MKRQRAQITVFLSLVLLCMAGLICTTLESARLYGIKLQGVNSLDLGLYSVFGEYNRELLEYYDVFFIDSAYAQEYRPQKLEKKLKDYISYELNPIQGIEENIFVDMWQVVVSSCKVIEESCATDNNGIVFRNQSVEYINENLKEVEIAKSFEIIRKAQGLKGSQNNINFDQVTSFFGGGEVENPLLPIIQLSGKSILSIIKEKQNISTKQINQGETISYRNLGGNQEERQELEIQGEKGEVLWQAYLLKEFKAYVKSMKNSQKYIDDSVLDYELEYIVFGQNSDNKNLELVVNRIYQIRQEKNLNYLRKNYEKLEEVNSLATILVGATTNPLAVKAVEAAIIYAWSYGESLRDISSLLAGDKVAFDKTDTTWKIQLSDLLTLQAAIQREVVPDDSGLTYEDYIQMLLYLNSSSQQNIRSLDLIEQNIRQTPYNKNIQLNHCVESVKVQCEFQGEAVFLKMPFIENKIKEVYSLKKERVYAY